MTIEKKREIAKFASGAEAFHAFAHGVLWLGEAKLTLFGITFVPGLIAVGLFVNAAIAAALCWYAWSEKPWE